MSETRAVKDLSIGDRIQVSGFDRPLVVRSAKKVQNGSDAGKLDMKLAGPDGNFETVRFDADEPVTVVGRDANRNQTSRKSAGKDKAKVSAGQSKTSKRGGKGKPPEAPAAEGTRAEVPPAAVVTVTQTEVPQTETPVVEVPQTGDGTLELAPAAAVPVEAKPTMAPVPTDTSIQEPAPLDAKNKRGKGKKAQPDADGQPAKLSAIDAAAKVLGETGQPLNCQELIGAMAAKGYWTSPAGKTPAGTLYSAILRELQSKGDEARFVKAARGQFTLRQPKA
jgi:hypothetical protein